MKKPISYFLNLTSSKKGFTLIELLIYISLLVVVGGIMGGVLMSVLRSSTQQTSDSELASQLNFVTKTVAQMVKQSSNIDIAAGVSTTTLKLRMQTATSTDPTCIYLSGGVVKLAQGNAGQSDKNNCTTNTTDLTSSNVVVNSLFFKKTSFYPGHDFVSIDLQMTYNSTNPQAQITRLLHSGFSRVSAATFDDNLLPGSSAAFDLGNSANTWRNGYFSGSVGIGTASPSDKLQVSGGSVIVGGAGSGTNYGIIFTPKDSDSWSWEAAVGGSGGLQFGVGGTIGTNPLVTILNSGKVGIGSTNPGHLLTMGTGGGYYNEATGAWVNGSDRSYKTNISDLTKYGLDTILHLRPVSYTVKQSGVEQIGFIAQEVKPIIPELVSGTDGSMALNYGGFAPVLTKAIQEQQKEIEDLKAEISALKQQISNLNKSNSN